MSFHLNPFMEAIREQEGVNKIGKISPVDSDWQAQLRQQLERGAPGQLPLKDQVFPGDQVAIAIAGQVPEAKAIADAMLAQLSESGIDMSGVSVVSTSPLVDATDEDAGRWTVHHSSDKADTAMVGVSRGDQAIYLNAVIANADVVIPVVPAGLSKSIDGYLYPAFSTQETQRRLRGDTATAIEEAFEAEQLVSPFYVVGIVPAPGNCVGSVLVDARANTDQVGVQQRAAFWTAEHHEFDAVVATLGTVGQAIGLPELLEALQNAAKMVKPGGPIVLLGELHWSPQSDEDDRDTDRTIDDTEDPDDLLDNENEDDEDDDGLDEDEAEYQDALELGDAMRETGWDTDDTIEQIEQTPVDAVEKETSQLDQHWDSESEQEPVPSPKELRVRLANLLEDLRSRQPVFLVSNLGHEQTEELGFGTMDDGQELKRLLASAREIGLMEEGYRWNIVQHSPLQQ